MEIDDNNSLDAAMGRFEAAVVKAKIELKPTQLDKVLLAVDRSNQDPSAIALAADIAKRSEATVHVAFAQWGEQSPEGRDYVIECVGRVKERGAKAEAVVLPGKGERHQHILKAREALGAQLIVVPAPYGSDIDTTTGDESLSATIDSLLAEARGPLLIVRHPHEQLVESFKEVIVAATLHANESVDAARWALRLVEPSGQLTLLAVADADTVAEAAALLGDQVDKSALGEEALKRAELRAVGALASAITKRATESEINSTVDVRAGKPAKVIAQVADDKHCIVCIGRPADRTSPAWHHTIDVILNAHHPVLVA